MGEGAWRGCKVGRGLKNLLWCIESVSQLRGIEEDNGPSGWMGIRRRLAVGVE